MKIEWDPRAFNNAGGWAAYIPGEQTKYFYALEPARQYLRDYADLKALKR